MSAERDKGHLRAIVSDNGIGTVQSAVPLTQLPNCGVGLTIVSDLIFGELTGQVTIEPGQANETGNVGTRVMINIPVARRESGS